MIEMLMYFVMGFLVAALSGLIILPLVHRRAVWLTKRRLEGTIPSSMAEVLADKDLLRAEFAVSTQQLETKIEELRAKSAREGAELGRKSDVINRLRNELGVLRAQLNATQESLAVSSNVYEHGHLLRDDNSGLREMPNTRAAPQEVAESYSDDAVAMRQQILALTGWLRQAGAEIRALNSERAIFESATKQVEEERYKFENFHRRAAELVQQLMVQANEDKRLSENIRELESRLAKQSHLLNKSELEIARLQDELDLARDAEADLRVALIEIDGRASATSAENGKLKASLDRANDERTRLTYELANTKRQIERVEAAA